MSAPDVTLALAALVGLGVFFRPALLRAPLWQATVTPLASIIGSGFLVAGPILSAVAGVWAWAAMLGLCAVGYAFGLVMRHNILWVEPELKHGARPLTRWLEGASNAALSLAYFVSVAYYLTLFAAFGLRLGAVVDPFWIHVVATAAIVFIGVVGAFGGLDGLEWLEVGAVGLKLSVIGGLFAALGVAAVMAARAGHFVLPAGTGEHGLAEAQVLLGLVILVQGFETSRFLGEAYDPATRVRTMRWAQWISTAVYLLFMLLATRYFRDGVKAVGGETAIIDMLRPVGRLVAPVLILAALASQFSAAVADTNGAAGLIAETSRRRLPVRAGNVITAAAAVVVVWSGDIYQIITAASKVFVLYYGLQSVQAAGSAWRQGWRGRSAFFAGCAALAAVIVLFARPAGA